MSQKGNHCPLLGKKCIEHKCAWYFQLFGTDNQTGQEVSEWGCVVGFIPMLMIENSAQQLKTSATVEHFRNESVSQGETLNQILLHSVNQTAHLLSASVPPEVRLLSPDDAE